MASPALGKRYGVRYSGKPSSIPSIYFDGETYGSTLAVAMQRAGERVASLGYGFPITVTFEVVERPGKAKS